MIDFVLNIRSESLWDLYEFKKIVFWRLYPPKLHVSRGACAPKPPQRVLRLQSPKTFGLNPPSPLVIRYHSLAFLNQVHKNITSTQFTKSTTSQKLNIATKKSHALKSPYQNIAHLLERYFFRVYRHILSDRISKTKNRESDFSFVSENCALFWAKN